MKIKDIRLVAIPDQMDPLHERATKANPSARRQSWTADGPVANPLTRFPRFAEYRPSWQPEWNGFGIIIEAEDGTTGFATGSHAPPVTAIIKHHLGPKLIGEECMAIEKVWDMTTRMTSLYGASGVASYAVSAIDLAMWDLKGKILDRPVYELIGGPIRDDIFTYATGGDTDWHMELGFKATKLPCQYGPSDGLAGLNENIRLVDETRKMIGADIDLMLDCWMAFDVEYAVRLGEALRPYNVKWLEDMLAPEDFDAFEQVRKRLPWQTLAAGEHWYTTYPFQYAASHRLVDIFQPDIQWVGGLTAIVKICAIAEAANISVIPHAGGNTPYGQHACHALSAIPWAEYYIGSPPGVPLEHQQIVSGQPSAIRTASSGLDLGGAVPLKGRLKPKKGPGFGVDVDPDIFPILTI